VPAFTALATFQKCQQKRKLLLHSRPHSGPHSAKLRLPGTDEEELPVHGLVVIATMNPAVAGGSRELPRNVANRFTQVGR
jgi:hypothetical protein